ncbi:MAG: glycoside hydrolase family 99-like domain-containing protein [Bacteroidales bacterium]|nr:glycoside hydrolase family 99-like domain-containing protein [Clostridium sp.]MCM1204362.1 glycoside hydrolase family 99-like domain-containing protein [Bacteroidales bacterium]
MNLVAYYLPQFHEIEENNRTWGKGFTEWDNVRKAKALFEGHYQPREPLNDNYYNLLNPDTLRWQISLAQKYGISAFCFYHYWFKGGKKVLEKPAELFLNSKDMIFQFCFSWANEPWTKTWQGASGAKEILIQQRYGEKEDWKYHFDYLLPFFKDNRYIKIAGKPMFLIYQINKIGCFDRMMDYWNELSREHGFKGLFIVDMLTFDGMVSKNKRVSATVDFEPGKAKRVIIPDDVTQLECHVKPYDETCCEMLLEEHKKNEFRCMFVDYDDTPRRGNRGYVYQGSSPEKFGMYLQKTIDLSMQEHNDFVFINAWNEWGEGNYLEPDKKYQFRYLEQVKKALHNECPSIDLKQVKSQLGSLEVNENKDGKFKQYYDLCNRWIKVYNNHYAIQDYFIEREYKQIAVYGLGELGNRLIEALEGTDIYVRYGIDKDAWAAFAEIDVKSMEEEAFDGVDCIVVTPIHMYEEIEIELRKKCKCPIISLTDVIENL